MKTDNRFSTAFVPSAYTTVKLLRCTNGAKRKKKKRKIKNKYPRKLKTEKNSQKKSYEKKS